MRRMFIALALITATPAVAQQQPKCGDGNEIRKVLKDKYNEDEISLGLVDEKTVFSIFVSPGGETWTLLATRADGISCFVGGGKHWMQGEVPIAGDPA